MCMDEKGFTLIETLIVLSILSILLLLPLFTFPTVTSTTHQAPFIANQLKEDILLAQQVALSTGKQTYVRMDNIREEYVIRHSVTDIYLKRKYAEKDMFIEPGSLDLS